MAGYLERSGNLCYDGRMERAHSILQRIHHVGHAVSDLQDAMTLYTSVFGGVLAEREDLPERGVSVAWITFVGGGPRIELLTPYADLGPEQSPVAKFLAVRGPGVHHIAYQVDDVARALAILTDPSGFGLQAVDDRPRPGSAGTRVAFIHPRSTSGVLFELVEVLA